MPDHVRYDPAKHHRRSIRLKGYDYSQPGLYFLTIIAQDRRCLFGEVSGGELLSSDVGRMIALAWQCLPKRFPTIELDSSVVMPNHLHGIVVLNRPKPRATTRVAPTIGDVVGAFKSLTTVEFVRGARELRWPRLRTLLWQRNYYEHILRDGQPLDRAREYILTNPARWEHDRENPDARNPEPDPDWLGLPLL